MAKPNVAEHQSADDREKGRQVNGSETLQQKDAHRPYWTQGRFKQDDLLYNESNKNQSIEDIGGGHLRFHEPNREPDVDNKHFQDVFSIKK